MTEAAERRSGRSSAVGQKTKRVPIALGASSRDTEFERMTSGFISTAAHELRTPLTSIRGFSELLLKQQQFGMVEPDVQKECLDSIVANSKRLERIVDSLLDLDHLSSGRGPALDRKPCKVASMAVGALLPFHEQHRGQFLLRLSERDTIVSVDREKMQQVLRELVENAFKFSTGGPVGVYGRKVPDGYQLCVRDEGIGMTPRQVDKIFDPFYRVDMSNAACEGMGLGLSLVRAIVQAHAGKIKVKSELGCGTRITVLMPLF